jgi:hypothetical protein
MDWRQESPLCETMRNVELAMGNALVEASRLPI